ncbi:3-deoxy-D-manno-octulosonic acid transferase [hydrothermal vent metagenome]|uniref:3-deoxy-D-manno-octulosonic acid transferase n=1 Tax=hydrothermal vent metagenome TaxID=652676 RepID=A0A3B0UZ60_9ZZZZ
MIFVYNFLQILFLAIGLPLLVPLVLIRRKYRGRTMTRLGFIPAGIIPAPPPGRGKIIWIHALSVGEVTSALPLVRGIRESMPTAVIIFSAATRTGMEVAEQYIRPFADQITPAPLDLLFAVNRYIRTIRPDLFILVESDFWPNWLNQLRRHNIPAMLVNGRMSDRSFRLYRRFRFFFKPMFRCLTLLSMQTEEGAAQMRQLGLPGQRILALGNLKYDTVQTAPETEDRQDARRRAAPNIIEDSIVWVCGSTHRGEEEIILDAYARLKAGTDRLALIIAPRDIGRSREIMHLAEARGLQAGRRTAPPERPGQMLILDTIGELASFYRLARVAFIGGSLVARGGHNPLEAAAHGVPVLFGPHMEDFREIARDLVQCGGAAIVNSEADLTRAVQRILDDDRGRASMSAAAAGLVAANAGVVARHLQEIERLLNKPSVVP